MLLFFPSCVIIRKSSREPPQIPTLEAFCSPPRCVSSYNIGNPSPLHFHTFRTSVIDDLLINLVHRATSKKTKTDNTQSSRYNPSKFVLMCYQKRALHFSNSSLLRKMSIRQARESEEINVDFPGVLKKTILIKADTALLHVGAFLFLSKLTNNLTDVQCACSCESQTHFVGNTII